jgi:hypothetical protein
MSRDFFQGCQAAQEFLDTGFFEGYREFLVIPGMKTIHDYTETKFVVVNVITNS